MRKGGGRVARRKDRGRRSKAGNAFVEMGLDCSRNQELSMYPFPLLMSLAKKYFDVLLTSHFS